MYLKLLLKDRFVCYAKGGFYLSGLDIRERAIELARTSDSAVVEPAHVFLACIQISADSISSYEDAEARNGN